MTHHCKTKALLQKDPPSQFLPPRAAHGVNAIESANRLWNAVLFPWQVSRMVPSGWASMCAFDAFCDSGGSRVSKLQHASYVNECIPDVKPSICSHIPLLCRRDQNYIIAIISIITIIAIILNDIIAIMVIMFWKNIMQILVFGKDNSQIFQNRKMQIIVW